MSLYHQLKHSGNPQAAVQTVISLLEKHSQKKSLKLPIVPHSKQSS